MGATFYIHIGMPKTGTSSIQQTLYKSRDQLLQHGINYLAMQANHGGIFFSLMHSAPHKYVANVMFNKNTPERADAFNEKQKKRLSEELSGNRSDKFVISGETLAILPIQKVRRFKQMLEPFAEAFKVIVYVRDPYEYANSATAQRVRAGQSFDDAIKDVPVSNYRSSITNFDEVFGSENVEIRIFDPRGFPDGDLIADFLIALGESPELKHELNVVLANQSLSHEGALILSELNVVVPVILNGVRNLRRLPSFKFLMGEVEGEKFSIDLDAYSKCEADIRSDVDWLHQKSGKLVFTNPKMRPRSVARWSEATIRSIKKIVANIAQEIHQMNEGVRPKRQYNIVVPAGLEWLNDSVKPAGLGQAEAQSVVVPPFDQTAIRSLACFIHEIAFTARKMRRRSQIGPRKDRPRVRDQADTLQSKQRMLP